MGAERSESKEDVQTSGHSRIVQGYTALDAVMSRDKDSINNYLKLTRGQKEPEMETLLKALAGIVAALDYTQTILRQDDESARYLSVFEAAMYMLAVPFRPHNSRLRMLCDFLQVKGASDSAREALDQWRSAREASLDGASQDVVANHIGEMLESPDRCRDAFWTVAFCCGVRVLKNKTFERVTLAAEPPAEFVQSQQASPSFSQNAVAQFFAAIALLDPSAPYVQLLDGFYMADSAQLKFSQAPGALNLAARYRISLASMSPGVEIASRQSTEEASESRSYLLDAVDLASRAIQLDPQYPEYFWTRGIANYELGNWRGGERDLDLAERRAALSQHMSEKRDQIIRDRQRLRERRALYMATEDAERLRHEISLDRDVMRNTTQRVTELSSVRDEVAEMIVGFEQQMKDQQRDQIQIVAFIAAALALVVTGAEAAQRASAASLGPTLLTLGVWLAALAGLIILGTRLFRRKKHAQD